MSPASLLILLVQRQLTCSYLALELHDKAGQPYAGVTSSLCVVRCAQNGLQQ